VANPFLIKINSSSTCATYTTPGSTFSR